MTAERFHHHFGDGRTWPGHHLRTSGSGSSGLRLAHAPGGSLSPASDDDSMGGLLLPRGLALDEEYRLFLLRRDGIACAFDGMANDGRGAFVELCDTGVATRPDEPRASLAVLRGRLFAFSQRAGLRVQALDGSSAAATSVPLAASLALSASLPSWLGHAYGRLLARSEAGVDLAADRSRLFVLLRDRATILRIDPHTLRVATITLAAPAGGGPTGRWRRFGLDQHDRFVLLSMDAGDPSDAGCLATYERNGAFVSRTSDPQTLRDAFDGPWIRLDENGRFLVPDFLWEPFRRRPEPGRQPLFADDPHAKDAALSVGFARRPLARPGKRRRVPLFDLDGVRHAFDPSRPRMRPIYVRGRRTSAASGDASDDPTSTRGPARWTSDALDSEIHRCSWGRLTLRMGTTPTGTRVRVGTLVTDDVTSLPGYGRERVEDRASGARLDAEKLSDAQFTECLVVGRHDAFDANDYTLDALVGGTTRPTGRYLVVRVWLEGDGFRTPVVESLDVAFPDESYARHLPAVWRANRESRILLERFLAVPQAEWDALEERHERTHELFDPQRVPDGAPLSFLASWIDAPIDVTDDESARRRILEATRDTLAHRGTPRGLCALVRALLADGERPRADDNHGFPVILEGFQERDRELALVRADGAPPWVPACVVGETSRVDGARLLSDASPEARAVARHAHRFDVHVPVTWLRARRRMRGLVALLEHEKPAHTAFRLRPVEAAFRIGIQARIGVDSVVAGPHASYLADEADDAFASAPRLGRNAFLAPEPRYPIAMPDIRLLERTQ